MFNDYRRNILLMVCFLYGFSSCAFAQKKMPAYKLKYPFQDTRGALITSPSNNPFGFDTSVIKNKIQYDRQKNEYHIQETIGNTMYRYPTILSYDDFLTLQAQEQQADYFRERGATLSALNRKTNIPRFRVVDRLFNRIFGVGPDGFKVKIKLQGTVDIIMGYQGQYVKNPTIPETARRSGGFNFNLNTNIQANAQIGQKLSLPINYNTLSNFNFQNQIKLDYRGGREEIIKYVKAGNISWQSKGSLIPSTQSLFGVSTQLQFGRVTITATVANQQSSTQNVGLQGGNSITPFNKKLDDYDENRNFLLSQYFRNNFNSAMSNLPIVNSLVQIQRIEVWVTNRTGATNNVRPIVAFTDMGESSPQNLVNVPLQANALPNNQANNLYNFLIANQNNRNLNTVIPNLVSRGLSQVDDYEPTYARLLSPSEYFFNPTVGFLCLNAQLQPNDVLGVAFQYTYNGRVYQVGEFSQDVPNDTASGIQKVLFVKMLKATSQRPANPQNPNRKLWLLMMKNVYSLGVGAIQKKDFRFDILYNQPNGGIKRYLPVTNSNYTGLALLRILNLDRLNNNNDPQPDGIFDFVDSFTVISSMGRVIFPVLEPFGRSLDSIAFQGIPLQIRQNYIYLPLYDSIKAVAQTFANLDRFSATGQVRGSGGGEIYLGGFNIPPGSVTVTAGGQLLQEGSDYVIDYNLGSLKILNQGIIDAGVPVNVQFENNATFGTQQKNFLGFRIDYFASRKLVLGGTIVQLAERPYFNKVNYGDDPIKNTMYGLDFDYHTSLPGLTYLLNHLPYNSFTAPSTLHAFGEGAYLQSGHASQIGVGNSGTVYIDDFENSTSNIDLRYPSVSWVLSSTPASFPESQYLNDLRYGYNRARLAWYSVEPALQDKTNITNPLRTNLAALSDPRSRQVLTQQLYPQQTIQPSDIVTQTLDVAYYPSDPGPYNFQTDPAQINGNDKFINPSTKWGGMMRALQQTDFETNNIQYVEFFIQDPFILNPNSTGGKLIMDLGLISEDILKDGKRSYEQGLPTPTIPAQVDTTTVWGQVPLNPVSVTRSFSNAAGDRPYQDVGLDGLSDVQERVKFRPYLNQLSNIFGPNATITLLRNIDPSNDDYVWYRDPSYDAMNATILNRYKYYSNPEGNSPIASSTANTQLTPAATLFPDDEDVDGDGILNQVDQYYEYEINLQPGMGVGTNPYITDKRVVNYTAADGTARTENWYIFRVPISSYASKVGNVNDFRSMRHMRMYLTGFTDSVVLRFAELNLVRNVWRTFTFSVDTTGNYVPLPANSPTTFDIIGVNIENNSTRSPVNYVIPPGIQRQQTVGINGVSLLQNEQSMSLRVRNLAPGDARAVLKTFSLDLRQYGQMSMFIHAESVIGQPALKNGDISAVIRIGQDFQSNYYEITVPLQITPPNSNYPQGSTDVWPVGNNLDFSLPDLINLKLRRNGKGVAIGSYYSEWIGGKKIAVYGNPNIGQIYGVLIAVKNNNISGAPINTEVWVDELRLSKINEQGGWAALGRVDVQMSDLGTLTVSANTYTFGFGSLDQSVNARAKNSLYQIDAGLNINLAKFLPPQARINLPLYASISRIVKTPQFDPYDQDVTLKSELANATSKRQRDSIRSVAIEQSTISTINLTNVGFLPKGHIFPWTISNFTFSYSLFLAQTSSPIITNNRITRHHFNITYAYNAPAINLTFFKRRFRNQSPWLGLIRDLNITPYPSIFGFRADIDRQFGIYVPRVISPDKSVNRVDTTYDKYLTFNRFYNVRWNLTRSIAIDFSAENYARVDEPFGALNTQSKRDTVLSRLLTGGRNVLYTQKLSVNYTLPFSKLPLTSWINAQYNFNVNYRWIAASLLAKNLGNFLENGQNNQITAQFDFIRLYQRSRVLRGFLNHRNVQRNTNETNNVNSSPSLGEPPPLPTIPPRHEVIVDKKGKPLKGKAKREALQKWRALKRKVRALKRQQLQSRAVELNGLTKAGAGLLTVVKSATISYNEAYQSRIPGWLDSTQILGVNLRTMQPGFAYAFGYQPNANWLATKARQGLLSKDSLFNDFFRLNYSQKIDAGVLLEPIRGLNVEITLQKTFSKDFQTIFKDTLNGRGTFNALNPLASGGFSVSYVSVQTLFSSVRANQASATFTRFQNNRIIISQRLAEQNPYWVAAGRPFTPDGYAKGYGRYQQNVLIPSFLSAYTGKSPYAIGLLQDANPSISSNPFKSIFPLPNWKLSYAGLTQLPFFAKYFSSFTVLHAYNCNLSMNGYSSLLNFFDPYNLGQPAFIDPTSGNYIPFYLVPNITIQESFSPLIGFDVTTINQIGFRFEYKKSRQLSLSLINYQMSEVNSTEWVVGVAWRKRGLKLPFKIPFSKGVRVLKNDLNLRFDFGIRNDFQSNSQLDQPNAYTTGGQQVISIQPSVDYVINNSISIRLFLDQRQTIPYISTAPPITSTNGGVQLRISLNSGQ